MLPGGRDIQVRGTTQKSLGSNWEELSSSHSELSLLKKRMGDTGTIIVIALLLIANTHWAITLIQATCKALDSVMKCNPHRHLYDSWTSRFYGWAKWDAEWLHFLPGVAQVMRGEGEHHTLVSLTPGPSSHPLLLLMSVKCLAHSRCSLDVHSFLFRVVTDRVEWQACSLLSDGMATHHEHRQDTGRSGWNDKHEEGRGYRALWTLWGI